MLSKTAEPESAWADRWVNHMQNLSDFVRFCQGLSVGTSPRLVVSYYTPDIVGSNPDS